MVGQCWPIVWMTLALAGCMDSGDVGDPSQGTGSDTTVSPTTMPGGPTAIRLSGTIDPLRQGFVANVSAYNAGPDTYGVGRSYCVSNYGAWSAQLQGPSGEVLDYRAPATTEMSCPGSTGNPMPPGASWNWTYSGNWSTASCSYRHVCDNWWDGNLTAEDGTRQRAPAGAYTWRFTFAYSVGASGGMPHVDRQHLDLPVLLP